ncbi:MAG: hypothetical protein WKG00_34620 [Polyangiaceae bacterium]
MSAKLMPAAATRIRTSPRRGTGTGASTIKRMSFGPFREVCCRAHIVVEMLIGDQLVFSVGVVAVASSAAAPSGM